MLFSFSFLLTSLFFFLSVSLVGLCLCVTLQFIAGIPQQAFSGLIVIGAVNNIGVLSDPVPTYTDTLDMEIFMYRNF